MPKTSSRLDARGISHLARNPECLRRISVYKAGYTPDDIFSKERGNELITMSPFQRSIGTEFEKKLLENSASRLLGEFHRQHLLPSPEDLECNGIIDIEEHYGSVNRATEPNQKLEYLAQKTADHLRQRLLNSNGAYLILNAVLKLDFAGYSAFIKPDFLIAFEGEHLFYPGEIKSILIRKEDTNPADLDKMKRQAAVEYLALERLYQQLLMDEPSKYPHIRHAHQKLAMLVVRNNHMDPKLYVTRLDAELDFLCDAEEVLLGQAPSIPSTLPANELDFAYFKSVTNKMCDLCESECGLASMCREQTIHEEKVSALGEDAERAVPNLENIDQVFALLSVEEPGSDIERLLREQLLNELDAAESSGGLKTLEELKEIN